MLDWIFEGIVTWISSVVSDMMDAVSGLFLQALGTDMTAMEEYFPFVSKAFTVMQYTAWALLFLITVWQLFRVFGGPVTEAENPWVLLGRSALFAFLIGYLYIRRYFSDRLHRPLQGCGNRQRRNLLYLCLSPDMERDLRCADLLDQTAGNGVFQ